MEVRVLGTVEVVDDAGCVLEVGPKERLVLARLAMAGGRTVADDVLEDAIWRLPPASARKTLQGYIHRLRRIIGPDRIPRESNGYRLVGVEIDAEIVEQLVRQAGEDRDPEYSVQLLRQAVGKFRDRPLREFDDCPAVEGSRRRFEELEQRARGDLLEAELAAGRHREVVADIEELVVHDPTDERGWCLLVTALALDGRQADSLGAIARARRALAVELGIEPGPRLRELEQRVLLQEFAPVAPVAGPAKPDASALRAHNLPARSTLYVETSELDVLRRLLASRRVLTIVGPGGAGKTRTAIELADSVLDKYPDGAWLVELAAVSEGADVVGAAAGALSVTPQSAVSTLESVIEWARGRNALLIVDNCEHVLVAAGDFVAAIQFGCPTVTIVATSREPLGIEGEQLHRLNVLDVENAMRLFCDRAMLADSTLRLSDDDLVTVATLCDRLDRLPLAIELAAAHVRWMSPSELCERLDARLHLIGSRSRRPARHETLSHAVAWSYELLTAESKTLFDRLSVFAGAFELAAVEAVCTSEGLEAQTVLIELGHLVDKSLVVSERHAAGTRFRLLETIRQFGLEALERREDSAEVLARHLRHYVRVAESANLLVRGPQELEGNGIFESSWDNLRAAHAWAIGTGDLENAERLILATRWFAHIHMRVEIFEWMVRTIELDNTDRHPHPEVFGGAAEWADILDDSRRTEFLHRGIETAPARDDPSTVVCWANMPRGPFLDSDRSIDLRDWLRSLDRDRLFATAFSGLDLDHDWWALIAQLESMHYHDERWPGCLTMLVERAARVRAPTLLAYAALYQGHAYLDHGVSEIELATTKYYEALALAREVGNAYAEAECLRALALAAAHCPTDPASARTCRDALIQLADSRQFGNIVRALTSAALVLAEVGRLEAASVVAGWLARERGFGREHNLGFTSRIMNLAATEPELDAWLARGVTVSLTDLVANTIDQLQGHLDHLTR